MVMKKLIAVAVVFAVVAGVAFAQVANGITVQAWGRVVFSPLKVAGAPKVGGETVSGAESTAYAGEGASWGGGEGRVDFRLKGATEYIGFGIGATAENIGSDGEGHIRTNGDDGAHIWAKPFGNDILKLTAGRFVDDTLRGKIGGFDGGFFGFVLKHGEEDTIFTRFDMSQGDALYNQVSAKGGFMISSKPIDALFIGIAVPGALDGWNGVNSTGNSGTLLRDAYRFMQIGLGYEIEGIGHVRAQWIGGWFGTLDLVQIAEDAPGKYAKLPATDGSTDARIEAAFALTAIDGLLVDIGGKFWLPVTDDATEIKRTKGVDVAIGASFRKEAFAVGARIEAAGLGQGSSYDGKRTGNGFKLGINLVPTYDLENFTVGGHLGAKFGAKSVNAGESVDKTQTTQFGFGGWIGKSVSGGSVKAGLAYTTPVSTAGKANGTGIFTIPVILEYAFF